MHTVGAFDVTEGSEFAFTLCWSPSYLADPQALEPNAALSQVETFWQGWAATFTPTPRDGQKDWSPAILRSLLTLKALAHWETGGIVAAGTTSLPESLGGRAIGIIAIAGCATPHSPCTALIERRFPGRGEGLAGMAAARRGRQPRTIFSIMYGVAGERRLAEYEASLAARL